jgi:hypothetical protein
LETTPTDVINATLALKRDTDTEWLTPKEYVAGVVDIVGDYAYDWANGSGMSMAMNKTEYLAYLTETATAEIDESAFNLAVWESTETTTEYDTEFKVAPVAAQSATGPASFAAVPASAGALLVLPQEWNWEELYNAIKTMMNQQLAANGTTWDAYIQTLGITKVVAKPRAFSIQFSFAEMDKESALYTSMIGPMIQDYEDMGYNISTGVVGFGARWNNKGLLSAMGLYIDAAATLNITKMLENTMSREASPPLPDVEIVEVDLSISQTAAIEGETPPSPEDIAAGNIAGGFIPGYPLGIVGVLGILSIIYIISKKRHE